MSEVQKHFDVVANDYDHYKNKNWYYYSNLKKLYRELIPAGNRVLEIGCGTGDLLAAVGPSYGVGIDISHEMIKIAQKKHNKETHLKFLHGTAQELAGELKKERPDYIFLCDVIEHLEDVDGTIAAISEISQKGTRLVISMANPIWEPALMILEKLKMKMPEGPHYRISGRTLEEKLKKEKFKIIKKGYRQLIPSKIPGVSEYLNGTFYKIPIVRNLGLTFFLVCEKL
jgi:ubiquinone/menaquinone biosynthesis C-methylase UbiE